MFEFQRELFPLSLSEPVERTREVAAEKTVGLVNGTGPSCLPVTKYQEADDALLTDM